MNHQKSDNSGQFTGENPRFTLPKSAKLRHRTLVNAIFEDGESLFVYPMRGVWRILSEEQLRASFRTELPEGIGPVQLMVTVPKKRRRHAVDRVRMRRLIKESFRMRRHELTALAERTPGWRTLSLAIIYIADKNIDFKTIDRKMGAMIKKLISEVERRGEGVSQKGEE